MPISKEKRKETINRSLPMDIPMIAPAKEIKDSDELSPRKATSRGISPRRTHSLQTSLSPSPPSPIQRNLSQDVETVVEPKPKARRMKSLGDKRKSPPDRDNVRFQPDKKKKKKEKPTITLAFQLRQGNLSEMYKLVDKIMNSDCFAGCLPPKQ